MCIFLFLWQFDWFRQPEQRALSHQIYWEHRCLKVVELRWFRGSVTDVEFATQLFLSAPNVEKIIIDCRYPVCIGTHDPDYDEEDLSAKDCARNLATQYLPAAELVIL